MLDTGWIFCKQNDAMTNKLSLSDGHARHLEGKQVSKVLVSSSDRLVIMFKEGSSLAVTWHPEGLRTQGTDPNAGVEADAANRPTKRQLDYLLFIQKYITRYGRAPAELDIERHFLVSAPSVNQMMQMLERRGFITRQPGVPRSTRLCIDLTSLT